MMGIPVDRMSTLAFGMAAALGAIGGIVLGPVTRATYDMGLDLGLKGFVAAVMGGLVRFPGAALGGLLLGVLENLWAGVTLAGFKDLFAFIVLILVLLARPTGFAGAAEEERVWRCWDGIGLAVGVLLVVLVGGLEAAHPLGLSLPRLTGGLLTLDLLIRAGIFTVVLVGLNLLMGYAGQVSLGQAAFYGMGAFCSAILTVRARALGIPSALSEAWWWPWAVMAVGA
ncbi:MAG: hypothetical protein C4314_02335, partial [Thermoflexus sp.]